MASGPFRLVVPKPRLTRLSDMLHLHPWQACPRLAPAGSLQDLDAAAPGKFPKFSMLASCQIGAFVEVQEGLRGHGAHLLGPCASMSF